jgi:hypothetical protein
VANFTPGAVIVEHVLQPSFVNGTSGEPVTLLLPLQLWPVLNSFSQVDLEVKLIKPDNGEVCNSTVGSVVTISIDRTPPTATWSATTSSNLFEVAINFSEMVRGVCPR